MTARILLAEDNQRLAGMLRSFLESLGHGVAIAADGDAVLAALEGGAPDLLILDLNLPGTSGIDVLRKVRASSQLNKLPVMIMTGVYRGEGYARAAEKLGVRAYLEKPFGKEEFLQAVGRSLQEIPADLQLADLLTELHHNRASGTVQLSCGTRIVFLNGEPASFSSDHFVPSLVSTGRLLPGDVEQCPHQGEGRLFLTRAGLLTYDDLVDQSRLFLSKRLGEALEKNQGATFLPGLDEVELPLTPLSLPRLLHHSSRAARVDAAPFQKSYAGLYPVKTREYYRLVNLFSMTPDEIELLEQAGRGGTIESVLSSCNDPSRGVSFLQFLIRMRMISLENSPGDHGADFPQKRLFNRPLEEARPEPDAMTFDDLVDEVSGSVELVVGQEGMAAPLSATDIRFEQEVQRDYAAIQEKNYYEMFALTQGTFSFQSLKEAYFSKTRQYTAEKFMQLSGATLTRAQDVLSHYANAYNTLSSVVAKERYDEMLGGGSSGIGCKGEDELQARIQFQSGKVFLEMGDYPSAERALQEAYTLNPQDSQICAHLGWSIYRNPLNTGSAASREKSRLLLSRSLQMGKCAEAFAFRGMMLLDEGRDGLAEGEFQKALKLNPRERTAQNGLRLLLERRENEKKGILKRIFG